MSECTCTICGKNLLQNAKRTGGQIHCPATKGSVCFNHCLKKCLFLDKETSLQSCLYRERLKIFANPQLVKSEMKRLKSMETEWLKTDYDILLSEYRENPGSKTVNRAELAAVRTLLFYRQFGKHKNGPQNK